MKKRRFNKTRILAALMSLCMIISLFNGIDSLFQNETIAQAEDGGVTGSSDYANETLEHMWDTGGVGGSDTTSFWNACRPYYACRGGSSAANTFSTFGGVAYRTIFHVFAFEGDTICVGSSVYESQMKLDHSVNTSPSFIEDEGSVDVVMTDLNGVDHPIDIRNSADNKTGYIDSPGTEYAAIKMTYKDGVYKGECNINGTDYTYTPYTYKVVETGVYTFEFHSYNKGYKDAPYNKAETTNEVKGYKRSDPFTLADNDDYTNCSGLIAALNLTVFNESGEKQTGRTYADFLSLQMQNANDGVRDTYYILTTDSYIYKMQFNGAAPYTYNFFSNNRGITDTSGEIVYKSVKDLKNDNKYDKFKIKFKYPGTKDTETDKSFYIFLEYPDDDLYGHLYEKALLPDPATDIKFVDEVEVPDGTNVGVRKVPGAYEGMGGYFSFKVGEATTATLRLEFKNIKDNSTSSDVLDSYAPVEISGPVTPNSTNYFYWDGCDGNGVPIPPGTYSINDIVFTVTAKAGEIHFPIIDMENANGGITFTRLSHIYDKKGNQLDQPGSIYDLTKNVIYYDDTAIYYGEKVTTVEGAETEGNVEVAKAFFANADNKEKYFTYNNVYKGGTEYAARQGDYIDEEYNTLGSNTDVRVGDHSHTTNIIKYFDEDGNLYTGTDQQSMIDYLDSSKYPVGMATSSGSRGDVGQSTTYGSQAVNSSTTDYAIANFWTFIPAKPETSTGTDQEITIVAKEDDVFNLRGRVFYDAKSTSGTYNGVFDQSSTTGEYLMPGVQVNLYKKTSDTSFDSTKTYVNDKGEQFTASNFDHTNAYELVESGETTLEGNYVFKGLKYDKTKGTEYLYQVVRPNSSYTLTSDTKKADSGASNGYYNNYACGTTYSGTEIQKIIVGGDGVDPTKKFNSTAPNSNPNCTVSAVDVGYYYETLDHMVTLKKSWKLPTETTPHPESVVFELSYTPKNENAVQVLKYFTLSGINSWKADNQYLAKQVDGKEVDNYFVSAEYYIWDGNIYKHAFDYNGSSGKYKSFVGTTYRMSLTDLQTKLGSTTEIKAVSDIELSKLADLTWGDAISVNDEEYRAVLDRETNTDTTITVTNSEQKGSIEIFKYYNKNEEGYALQGATFRIYQLDETNGINVAYIKDLAAQSDSGDLAATTELRGYQVGSGTTRANGRLAFPGLDPTKSYVIREMFPPAGYRILRDFYEVHPANSGISQDTENGIYLFDAVNNYVQLDIGNAPSDSDFYIIKQIEGRAWQGEDDTAGIKADSFSFTILNEFVNVAALSDAKGVEVSSSEIAVYDSNEANIISNLTAFANEFKKESTAKHNNITVNNDCTNYSYDSVDIHGDTHHFTFPDRKNSDKLLEPGSETGEPASFCGVGFTVAGVYTFTITEDDIAEGSTLTKSPLVYTVKINVKRELKEDASKADPLPDKNLDNSYLVAEVSSITYTDGSGSTPQVFAGSSPLFTNVYAPAPAEQTTSYNIFKSFTGREGDKWLEGDEFTVKVVGDDSATQEAIENKNLIINGLLEPNIENGWEHKFTFADHVDWNFESFTFDDIIFQVEYVDDKGNVWNPDEHEGAVSPDPDDIDDYKIQTIPVEYWLRIYEDIPSDDHKGVTYDSSVYYLQIILRNTEKDNDTEEEEDGIIDEMDLNLYKCTKGQTRDKGTLVATCSTVQRVVKEADWHPDVSEAGVTWWYLTNTGELKQYIGTSGTPTNYKKLIKKTETHTNETGTDGHTMTITNTYSAQAVWTPQVEKILTGRTWRPGDKFTFKIAEDGDNDKSGYTMTTKTTVDISNETSDYTDSFGSITFTKPGTYKFTLAERLTAGGITQPEPITITVTATDNNDGTLSLVFEFTDAEGNKLDEFKDYTVADPIKRTNIYNDTSEEFALEIEKKIIGRNWKDDDSFTFTIMPDAAAKTAIEGGFLTMPDTATALTKDEDTGNYTATISGTEGATATDVITKVLGNIIINGLPADEDMATYTFTISEDTTNLAEKNMLCRHDTVTLTVEVARVMVGDIPTGELNVSATYKYGDGTEVTKLFNTADTDPSPTTPLTATIPFENISLGTLTVEKEVVSSNDDETEFSFTATFKLDADKLPADITEKERTVKVTVDGEEKTLVLNKDTEVTYTFSLKHGDSITFSNILPNTTYTITEGTEPANYMFLRIMDKNGNNVYNESDGQKVTEQINVEEPPDKYTFISGKIHNLPSAGGTGTQLILLGALALIIAAALFYTIFHKNDKRREAR